MCTKILREYEIFKVARASQCLKSYSAFDYSSRSPRHNFTSLDLNI